LLSAGTLGCIGSTLANFYPCPNTLPSLDLPKAKLLYGKLHQAINKGLINSAHDISDGGLLTTLCESIIGSSLGANININLIANSNDHWQSSLAFLSIINQANSTLADPQLLANLLFAEGPGHIIVTAKPENKDEFLQHMAGENILELGTVTDKDVLEINVKANQNNQQYKWQIRDLANAWSAPLPFA
jgi:phosphoribosylformylglycinamidine synthase